MCPSDVAGLASLALRAADGAQSSWSLVGARSGPGGSVLVRLEGLDDRTAAEVLKGAEVLVSEDTLPVLGDDEYYYFELEGLDVVDTEGSPLGRISSVFNAGASDVATVVGDDGEWMLPVIDDVVVEIDREAGRMVVSPLEGLVEGGV